jgi:hypothetical protein
MLGDLPIGEVDFVQTDLYGCGLGAWWQGLPDEFRTNMRVDVTPGTKGQACALARLPGAQLWSLQGHRGLAAALDGGKESLPLSGPPLFISAAVTGGTLQSGGRRIDAGQRPARAGFLDVLIEFIGCLAADGRAFQPGPSVSCTHGRVTTHRRSADEASLAVTHRGRSATGSIEGGGFWLEELVAYALVKAGADEALIDISWDWSSAMREYLQSLGRYAAHRRELDVAARFGHQIVAVSCKTLPPRWIEPERLDAMWREIQAVAFGAFGNFAAAILVLSGVRQRPTRPEIPVIGMEEICDFKRLRVVVDSALGAHDTLTEP